MTEPEPTPLAPEKKKMVEQETQSNPIEEIKITSVIKNKACQTEEIKIEVAQTTSVPPLRAEDVLGVHRSRSEPNMNGFTPEIIDNDSREMASNSESRSNMETPGFPSASGRDDVSCSPRNSKDLNLHTKLTDKEV